MRLVVAVLVVLVPAVSHADERRTFVSIGGTAGGVAPTDGELEQYDLNGKTSSGAYPLLGPRVMLSWEHALLAGHPGPPVGALRGLRRAARLVGRDRGEYPL